MPLSDLRGKILIVDDDPLVLEALHLAFLDTYDVIIAHSGPEALVLLEEHRNVDAIILDIRMAKMDGFETASRIRSLGLEIPIVFNTGYPGEYSKRQELAEPPFAYVGKNEGPEKLHQMVYEAVRSSMFKTHSGRLIAYARDSFGMVGRSQAMLEVFQQIDQISRSDHKVMILGDTGTGKELVAKAIHRLSTRANYPFVPCSCGHKSAELIEDELFGHVRGAFTGSVGDRAGLLLSADKGTIFLDEIGELDENTQIKFLRFLETQQMTHVGSDEPITVNVRVICATNADLVELVRVGRFRKDLFYRLKGFIIRMPKLRDRREDIPAMIDYFTEKYCRENHVEPKYFEQAARDLLIAHNWEGNVRDLRETIETALASNPSYFIARQDIEKLLGLTGQNSIPVGSFDDQVRDFKRILIIKALDRHSGNVSKVAREFGKDPANLRKQIESLGITLGQ